MKKFYDSFLFSLVHRLKYKLKCFWFFVVFESLRIRNTPGVQLISRKTIFIFLNAACRQNTERERVEDRPLEKGAIINHISRYGQIIMQDKPKHICGWIRVCCRSKWAGGWKMIYLLFSRIDDRPLLSIYIYTLYTTFIYIWTHIKSPLYTFDINDH